jgi:hypothetical protein
MICFEINRERREDSMIQIFEDDMLNAGKKQVIISNDVLKVIIVPEVGGRIADIQSGESSFLHKTYPQGVSFGPYTEYGGIEECIGSAPGSLWNASWTWEKKENGILLQVLSRSILVRKLIAIHESEPIIKIKYDFSNTGNTFSRFTFGIHPEICLDGVLKDNLYYIPSTEGLIDGGYSGAGFKKSIASPDIWCAVTHNGKVFGQMFPKGVFDSIEIYYPRVDTHLVIQPMIFGVGIAPDKRAGFTYMIYAGEGDAEKIRELRNSLDGKFSVEYESYDKKEIPENVMMASAHPEVTAEPFVNVRIEKGERQGIEQLLDMRKGKIPKIPAIPTLPQIPNIPHIPDIGAIVRDALSGVTHEIEMMKKTQKDIFRQTGEMPAGEVFANKIKVKQFNGNINIQSWDNPHIGHNLKVPIKQKEDTAIFDTRDDLWLEVPRSTSEIDLSFLNSSVVVSGVSSDLKISGVNGKIDVSMEKLNDNSLIKLTMVTGNINLKIPKDSSCTINAGTINGRISHDLPLIEKGTIRTVLEENQTNLSGVLNDGTAKVLLNTVNGNISIEGL